MAFAVKNKKSDVPSLGDTPHKAPFLKKIVFLAKRMVRPFSETFSAIAFSSLMRRIVVLNAAALVMLMTSILYLNQFRAGLIDAKVESLLTQGRIISRAIAATTSQRNPSTPLDLEKLLTLDIGEFDKPLTPLRDDVFVDIDPQRISQVLRQLIPTGRTRARLYDSDGELILDTRYFFSGNDISRTSVPDLKPDPPSGLMGWVARILNLPNQQNYPTYEEFGPSEGRNYPELASALDGSDASSVRVGGAADIIVSVGIAVERNKAVVGGLLLSTQDNDIGRFVDAERAAIFRTFLVAGGLTFVLSVFLAATIALPLKRLSIAAESVSRSVNNRRQLPEFGNRSDEIGDLSNALQDMTSALYDRIDAIDRFAADVSHELKNPLTSLRSAVETMPLAKTEASQEKLLNIIKHDVIRLDRLISDISDASRLDSELAREGADAVNIEKLVRSVLTLSEEVHSAKGIKFSVVFKPPGFHKFYVLGHETRLGQVVHNIVDNAVSFVAPEQGAIDVTVTHDNKMLIIAICDNGPGISPDSIDRIFKRFYTDRPDIADFGRNSGLGLSISKQIVEAHRGTLIADNLIDEAGKILGARFVISLPCAP